MHEGELELNKQRDETKNLRAEQLNIPLIRINYKEQNHITEPWLRHHIEEFIGSIKEK